MQTSSGTIPLGVVLSHEDTAQPEEGSDVRVYCMVLPRGLLFGLCMRGCMRGCVACWLMTSAGVCTPAQQLLLTSALHTQVTAHVLIACML